jgi:hypothetical protein
MRARASALTGHSGRGVWLMTFHSACARILRRDGHALGYTPTFTIYDTADSRSVIKRLLGAAAGEDSEQAGGVARGVHAEISAAKNQMLSVEQWLSRQSYPDLAGTTAQVWHAYDAELRRANALDFDDLLLATHRLLAEHHEIAEEYRGRFAHVFVAVSVGMIVNDAQPVHAADSEPRIDHRRRVVRMSHSAGPRDVVHRVVGRPDKRRELLLAGDIRPREGTRRCRRQPPPGGLTPRRRACGPRQSPRRGRRRRP